LALTEKLRGQTGATGIRIDEVVATGDLPLVILLLGIRGLFDPVLQSREHLCRERHPDMFLIERSQHPVFITPAIRENTLDFRDQLVLRQGPASE
jgi:hypothetical protein